MNSGIQDQRSAPSYDTPGVYYETLARARARPAFLTGVPVFVGFAKPTRINQEKNGIHHIERWQQFLQWYTPAQNSYLGYAVRGFFENGGEHCVIVPVQSVSESSGPENMVRALTDVFADQGVLDDIEDIDLVCVPDAMLDVIQHARDNAVLDIQSAALEHCRRMSDRFAILDGFENDISSPHDIQKIEQAVTHWRELPPEHGALYFPWIYVNKSLSTGDAGAPRSATAMPCETWAGKNFGSGFRRSHATKLIPPCGHVAGIYSRTDAAVGVHKAPANEALEGVFKLGIDLSDKEQGILNNVGVNCLRNFPGRGIRVWGARTLSGQPDWLYINVRRLFLTLIRWVRQNMNDVIFEGNTPALWGRVNDRLYAYCRELFDRGALMGSSPAEAFFIKCDAETNPRESREAGLVITDVGLAPSVPSEFVVVRITQSASAITVTGSNVV